MTVHRSSLHRITAQGEYAKANFADFELGRRNALISKFPQHNGIIMQLTRA